MFENMPGEPPKIPEELLWAIDREAHELQPYKLQPEQEVISGVKVQDGVLTFHAINKYIRRPEILPLSKGPFNPNKN